jgi:CheY-like chemotaxis protein
MRVYVVDDDPAVRNSMRALLVAHRFEVVACPSAEDFLTRFDREVQACLLLDIRMPGMSGLDLQAFLRKHGILLPVIILTGHGDVPAAVRAMKAGAQDFIEKPAAAAARRDRPPARPADHPRARGAGPAGAGPHQQVDRRPSRDQPADGGDPPRPHPREARGARSRRPHPDGPVMPGGRRRLADT